MHGIVARCWYNRSTPRLCDVGEQGQHCGMAAPRAHCSSIQATFQPHTCTCCSPGRRGHLYSKQGWRWMGRDHTDLSSRI